jgi:hypothetical protein
VVDNLHEAGPVADNSGRDPRIIGEINGSANAPWTLCGKEAKYHDEARVQTPMIDMDGVLIFVRSYLISLWFTFNFTFMFTVVCSFIDGDPNAIFAPTLDARTSAFRSGHETDLRNGLRFASHPFSLLLALVQLYA